MSQPQLVSVEEDVAETLARLIEAVILPVEDLGKGHELTDVIHDKAGCCQGKAILYFALGNSIGLRVQGLQVRILAHGPESSDQAHEADLVRLADGSMVMVDVTKQVGRQAQVSKSFRFDDVYRRYGNHWELKDKSNPLGLHRVVRPVDASGLAAELYQVRAHDCLGKGDYDKAIADCSEAIRLDPKYAVAYNQRGWAYEKKHNHDRAIADYTAAILLNPK